MIIAKTCGGIFTSGRRKVQQFPTSFFDLTRLAVCRRICSDLARASIRRASALRNSCNRTATAPPPPLDAPARIIYVTATQSRRPCGARQDTKTRAGLNRSLAPPFPAWLTAFVAARIGKPRCAVPASRATGPTHPSHQRLTPAPRMLPFPRCDCSH